LIKVDPHEVPLKRVPLGDADSLKEGDRVVALAAQAQLSILSATGRVTGLEQGVEEGNFRNKLVGGFYDDIKYPSPNSPESLTVIGGPVFDASGHVVGIVGQLAFGTHGYSEAWDYDGDVHQEATAIRIALFAVKNLTMYAVPEDEPEPGGPYLGVSYSLLTPKAAKELGLHPGALVEEVVAASPAETAGLIAGRTLVELRDRPYFVGGDVITSMDGLPLDTENRLIEIIDNHEPGDVVPVQVWRDGERLKLDVVLGERP
jgi:serine protease Do